MTTAHCPGCHCRLADDAKPAQPATSSPGMRKFAKDATEAAVRSAKDARLPGNRVTAGHADNARQETT